MENSHPIQRFVNVLYDIYSKTYYERKIAEYHCEATEKLLQLSNDSDDRYITNGSGSKKEEISGIECNCKPKAKDKTLEIENQLVQDIETAINKAKTVRSNDKKTGLPYLTQSVKQQKSSIPQILSVPNSTARSMTAVTLNNAPKIKTLNKFTNNQKTSLRQFDKNPENLQKKSYSSQNGYSKTLIAMKTKSLSSTPSLKNQSVEHLPNCPKNKDLKISCTKTDLTSKSRVSLGYPASLESIRIPSEIQRALKLYYKFVNEKDTVPVNRRSKIRSLFLQKLDEVNSRNWELWQKEDFKSIFELNVYINTYESQEDNVPSTSLCRSYDNENLMSENINTIIV
ncbi:uncharacterized protein LOC123298854 [Chrysoperla carnea]|uniref:uncharacterized protein LOC123298854 n=1 Tax=Chrysoperla carnea TaxID=189513 RepID=UPI001D06C9F6|nr:uncharacterized protein LOC123298854 [Chrysoperla carnea]